MNPHPTANVKPAEKHPVTKSKSPEVKVVAGKHTEQKHPDPKHPAEAKHPVQAKPQEQKQPAEAKKPAEVKHVEVKHANPKPAVEAKHPAEPKHAAEKAQPKHVEQKHAAEAKPHAENKHPAEVKHAVEVKHPEQKKPAEHKVEAKHVEAKHTDNKKNEQKPKDPKQPAQAKPVVQKQQQPQEKKQEHQEVVANHIKISKSIKLPQMIGILEQDKSENLTSLLIDTTGNAFTFFKYKGDVIDVSEMIIQQSINGVAQKENVEKARKTLVYALKGGGMAVFHLDIASSNLTQQFNEPWYKPEKIFQYSQILQKDYYKKELIKPEEDVDTQGNKGWFEAKEHDFRIVLVAETKGTLDTDPYELLKKLGLENYQHYFRATQIVE